MLQTLVFNNEYCDEYAVVAFAVPVDVLEFSAISQIITHAEKRSFLVVRRSEPLSSLGATSLQHQPSILAGHPRPEAMRFGTPTIVRLKSAFRHSDEFSSKTKTVRLIATSVYVKERTPI
jgi:hypothetical protein